jgi:hypothetical protein
LIGFQVVGFTKDTESDDVMNVKLPHQFLFGNAATLTTVVVSLARGASLRLPVWAVVSNVTTSPSGRVFATHLDRVRSIRACATTETRLVGSGWIDGYANAAPSAYDLDLIVKCMIAALVFLGICLCRAALTAIVVLADLVLRTLKFAAANLTDQQHGIAGRRLVIRTRLALLHLASMSTGASRAAIVMRAASKAVGFAFENLVAIGARNFDAIAGPGHKKRLLLVVDRVLVEGIRALTRGMASIVQCTLLVNNCMPSTGVFYHTFRGSTNGK